MLPNLLVLLESPANLHNRSKSTYTQLTAAISVPSTAQFAKMIIKTNSAQIELIKC